jgi:hypothetical protein
MCVLLQYNVSESYTHEELLNNSLLATASAPASAENTEATQAAASARSSAEENLAHVLTVMTKARILNAAGEIGQAATRYSLNMGFSKCVTNMIFVLSCAFHPIPIF